MIPTSRQITDQRAPTTRTMVAGNQGDVYFEPSEISFDSDARMDAAPDASQPPRLDPAAALERLETLVAVCRSHGERSPFDAQKERLLTDLASPYAVFCLVEEYPDLAAALHKHKALEGRVRGLSKDKTALLSIYCKMYPNGADQKKKCSDWTAWLEQAHHEKTAPGNFVTWGMGQGYVDCRDKVRERRRVAKLCDDRSTGKTHRGMRLKLQETSKGVSVIFGEHRFSIPEAVAKKVFAMVKRAAPEGLLGSSNDNATGDTHE